MLAGADAITEIALFGDKKLGFLRRFRPFLDGTPTHGHLGDMLATLDADAVQRRFVARIAALTGACEELIAIDGKTVRRSLDKRGGKAAIHTVSAFAARQRLVLTQLKVAEKSNEIVAIPKLLKMLEIEGAIVTIAAMGCQRGIAASRRRSQRDIAQRIIDKKADYVLALKGNQASLRDDVELFVTEERANGFKHTTFSQHRTVDGDHGRIETRNVTVIHDIAWLR